MSSIMCYVCSVGRRAIELFNGASSVGQWTREMGDSRKLKSGEREPGHFGRHSQGHEHLEWAQEICQGSDLRDENHG